METLRYGQEGYYVSLLQLGLLRAGQEPGALDGIFGRRTLSALTAFQRAQGLSADGIAGNLTWTALYPYLTGYTFYQVCPGDSFYSIAKAKGITPTALAVANPNLSPDNLPVGEMLILPLPFDVVTEQIPYSHVLNGLALQGLVHRYPFIQLTTIGTSVMGRPLYCATIGTGAEQVFCNASHHGNEWITTPVLLKFLEDFAKSYALSPADSGERQQAQAMYTTATTYLIPLVNPDGVDLVTGALSPEDSYYRQAQGLASYYPVIPFPEGWKANINGVDLNLQYPAGWEQAREIKTGQGFVRPGPRDYVGAYPLCAPESRAVAEFTRGKQFARTLSYHTQGEVIYWRYQDIFVPGAQELGEALSRASGYVLDEVPEESSFAGYKDWFIDAYRRPGYTIEAGRGQNPLPLTDFPAIYAANKPLLTTAVLGKKWERCVATQQ